MIIPDILNSNFLTNCPQDVRVGLNLSSTFSLSSGVPQGYVLSPLLAHITHMTCIRMSSHTSSSIIMMADDTVFGLILGSTYLDKVPKVAHWCPANNHALKTKKTKEAILDCRKCRPDHSPIFNNRDCVEIVHSFKFLGCHVSDNPSRSIHTTATIQKSQKHLWLLKKEQPMCEVGDYFPPLCDRVHFFTVSQCGIQAVQ